MSMATAEKQRGGYHYRELDIPATPWQKRAVCAEIVGYLDMPYADQVAFCAECPVRAECLQFGLATHPEGGKEFVGGAYGGLTPAELVKARKRMRRGAS